MAKRKREHLKPKIGVESGSRRSRMRHRWFALGIILLTGCSPASKSPGAALGSGGKNATPASEAQFVILHTNDMHSSFRASRPDADSPPVGGVIALSAYIGSVRNERGKDKVLLLDAGNLISGTPLDEYEENGVRGGAMLSWLKSAEYDAWTLGSHEFDFGPSVAKSLVVSSPVPVLSSNLDAPGGGPGIKGILDSRIFALAGSNVGVVGVTHHRLQRQSGATVKGMMIRDPVDSVKEQIGRLAGQVDMVVVLSSLGIKEDRRLATSAPGIDLIIGSAVQGSIGSAEQIGDTWVVQGIDRARGIGSTVVTPMSDGEFRIDHEQVFVNPERLMYRPSADVVMFNTEWSRRLDKEWGAAVGISQKKLTRSVDKESDLGRFVSMVIRESLECDVGLYESGALRNDLKKGVISREDLYEVFPFGTRPIIVEVKGSDLMAIALRNANTMLGVGSSRVLQQNGIIYSYRQRMEAAELVRVMVGESIVNPTKTYRVAVTDGILSKWSDLTGSPAPVDPIRPEYSVLELIERRIRREMLEGPPAAGGTLLE
jgi:2',3'-cyclic-nucleotide 2'-phosphodiesterase (5'-nucleotidase family)